MVLSQQWRGADWVVFFREFAAGRTIFPASVKGERDNFDRYFEGFPVVENFRKIYIRNRENETFLMVLSKHNFETKNFDSKTARNC